MKHICHVTSVHTVFDTRIFRRECRSLAAAGFRVSLIAQHDKEESVEGVEIVPLRRPRNRIERRLLLPREAGELARSAGADLYHFHDPELIPVMRRIARLTSRPVIWDAHENYVSTLRHFNQMGLLPLSALAAKVFDRLEIAACRRYFGGVVTITERMAERYRVHAIPVCVVGNFADLEAIPDPGLERKAAIPRFVSSGAHLRDRAPVEIADAFALVRQKLNCELAVWGTFSPADLEDEIRGHALALGAPRESLLIGGPVAWNTLVRELLPTAWVGCVLLNPRDANNCVGLPNRLFEYWCNAIPVIATAGTEVARLVEEVGGGVVVGSHDPQVLAEAFLELARDPARVTRMGALARAAVEARYNWSSAFVGLLAFYKSFGIQPDRPHEASA